MRARRAAVRATGWGALALTLPLAALTACNRDTFSPTSADVQTARVQATAALTGFLDGLLAPTHPAASGELDVCVEGQHNWKVDDTYDHRCTYARVLVGSLPGPDLSAARVQLNEILQQGGCAVTSGPTQGPVSLRLTCDAAGRTVTLTAQPVSAADPDLLDLLQNDVGGSVLSRTRPDLGAAASAAQQRGDQVLVAGWSSTDYYAR